MKRFLLFAGPDYYASGGAQDLEGSFDTLEDATANLPSLVWEDRPGNVPDWVHVLDTEPEAGQIVAVFVAVQDLEAVQDADGFHPLHWMPYQEGLTK